MKLTPNDKSSILLIKLKLIIMDRKRPYVKNPNHNPADGFCGSIIPVMSLTSGGATIIKHVEEGKEKKVVQFQLNHDITLLPATN